MEVRQEEVMAEVAEMAVAETEVEWAAEATATAARGVVVRAQQQLTLRLMAPGLPTRLRQVLEKEALPGRQLALKKRPKQEAHCCNQL